MGKKHKVKKHQNDPGDCETSDEESQLEFPGKTCAHITRGVNLSNVKKIFKAKLELGMCQHCGSRSIAGDDVQDASAAVTIWMCLQCGNQGCGRYSQDKHAIQHYQTPRSDCHALAINMSSWEIWCYDCDENVAAEWNKKLGECVDYLKRHAKVAESVSLSNITASNIVPEANIVPKCTEDDKTTLIEDSKIAPLQVKGERKDLSTKSSTSVAKNSPNKKPLANCTNGIFDNLPKVKGLLNLGNTCFFNSVMQCLAQTHLLRQMLDSECVKNSTVQIAGTYVDLKDKDSGTAVEVELPSITVSLGEGGGMTQAMSLFLKEMHSNEKIKTLNPGHLLGQICKRSPQFRGAQQQDSHELLRHLLDGLKSEETKRHQAGILKVFGLPTKIDPKSVEIETKAKVKAYGKLVQQTLVDKIFSGQLISTVLCEECRMSSQVFEPFLDLSLPVTEEKVVRPGLAKKSVSLSKSEEAPPSKYQEKKAKKQAKKDAKVQRNKEKQQRRQVIGMDKENMDSNKETLEESKDKISASSLSMASSNEKDGSEISDADVEDNTETGSTCSLNLNGPTAPAMVSGKDLVNEWCVDVTNGDGGSRETMVDGPHLQRQPSPDESYASRTMAMDPEELSRKICDLRIRQDNLEGEVDSSEGWGQQNGVGDVSLGEEAGQSEGEDCDRFEDDEDRQERKKHTMLLKLEWMTKSLTTLAPRYQPSSHECSVLSCLNQFTAPELLTGPNKFGCENCTRLKREKDHHNSSSEGKKNDTVYTNASKQLLIFNPPAVLTLHLKRFQQAGFRLLKVNRHVEFPVTLNLAAFCSSICLGLPTLSKGQKEVPYSLFAVVEHSGRLTGGHYTAYVKVRPSTIADGSLTQFLNMRPANQCDVNRLVEEMHRKLSDSAQEDEGVADSEKSVSSKSDIGRWYYISDGHVSDASEATVLKCQAYLLFYERIV